MEHHQEQPVNSPENIGTGRTSVKIGIIMLVAWILPITGIPLGVIGLVLGFLGLNVAPHKEYARAGIFLNALGLFITGINMLVSFYLLTTGGFDPFQFFQ